MDITRWRTQLMKGAAELAVLACVRNRRLYGLEILQAVQAGQALRITEGTLYPLLNRLQRDGKLQATWVEEGDTGHPRKYYSLTDEGTRLLTAMKEEWSRFSAGMNLLLSEKDT